MLEKGLLEKTDNSAIQMVRSLLSGGVSFLVDFLTLYILTDYVGLHYLQSTALAFLGGVITCYLFSITWVFCRRSYQSKSLEFAIFALLSLIGLGLTDVIMYALTDGAGCYYLVSKIVATVVVFFWNFFSRKFLLFQQRSSSLQLSSQESS
jgi:putative flippase GtrA